MKSGKNRFGRERLDKQFETVLILSKTSKRSQLTGNDKQGLSGFGHSPDNGGILPES